MKKNNQSGFSLIELLLVVTIIGIIAAIGVPSFQKGLVAASNGSTFQTMRSMASTQVNFYSQNNRYGRLSELNSMMGNGLGTPSGADFVRGKFTFTMTPATDDELKTNYIITATSSNTENGVPYVFTLDQTGRIKRILPTLIDE